MSLPRLCWDIETSALPLDQLERMMPEFQAAKNIKDPAKIAADIAEKRQSFIDDAALKATTGMIVAYTAAWDDAAPQCFTVGDGVDEGHILNFIRDDMSRIISESGTAYSFNGHGFDIPFICQRAIVNGLPIIRSYLTSRFRGRVYPHDSQIDIMREWLCGNPDYKGQGLDAVAKALGLAGKTGSGKDFAKLLETDREAALNYAKQDVELVRSIAKKMNL